MICASARACAYLSPKLAKDSNTCCSCWMLILTVMRVGKRRCTRKKASGRDAKEDAMDCLCHTYNTRPTTRDSSVGRAVDCSPQNFSEIRSKSPSSASHWFDSGSRDFLLHAFPPRSEYLWESHLAVPCSDPPRLASITCRGGSGR